MLTKPRALLAAILLFTLSGCDSFECNRSLSNAGLGWVTWVIIGIGLLVAIIQYIFKKNKNGPSPPPPPPPPPDNTTT